MKVLEVLSQVGQGNQESSYSFCQLCRGEEERRVEEEKGGFLTRTPRHPFWFVRFY